MSFTKTLLSALVAVSISSIAQASTIIAPVEDVMTSGFFMGTNLVRGYAGDSRPTFRVSQHSFGIETIYINFDATAIASLTEPVSSAILTMESVSGGFGADAAPGPFTVSAHAVDTDPLVAITDDTNVSGPISWDSFLSNNVLTADPAALTDITGFGTVTFDVTVAVNDWISGANSVFSLALTGNNHTLATEYLHGFLNNTEAPGSTFLTVTSVPEPTSVVLLGLASAMVLGARRKNS